MGPRLRIVVLVVSSLLAGACGGARPGAATGVLTGTAQACASLQYVATARVEVYRNSVLVASRHVPNGGTYRFVLPPGRYDVTDTGNPEPRSGRAATVIAGRTSSIDVPDMCF